MECNCLFGYDVGVPYSGIAYLNPTCELHNEPEELCYHGYPGRGTGCYFCEGENE